MKGSSIKEQGLGEAAAAGPAFPLGLKRRTEMVVRGGVTPSKATRLSGRVFWAELPGGDASEVPALGTKVTWAESLYRP